MRVLDFVDLFWMAKQKKLNERDRIVVDGNVVRYLLWGHEIARWERDEGLLRVSDCGYRTNLTKNRLNMILAPLDFYVFSRRKRWYIEEREKYRVYKWMGEHVIDIKRRTLHPSEEVRRAKSSDAIAKALEEHYERARRAIVLRKRVLAVKTLDGTASYLFVKADKDTGRLERKVWTVVVLVEGQDVKAWRGLLPRPKVFKAFANSDIRPVIKEIGWFTEVDSREALQNLLETLRVLGFTLTDLPKSLVSALSILQVIYT